jgi:flagellar basal body P-ring formation protein FlgA
MTMSNRILIVFLAAFFALLIFNARNAGATGVAAPVPAPVLKAETTVQGETVRLGDLLENAGAAAVVPVFHAPELGTSGTIQTFRIIEAARQNGIAYFETRGLSEVTIFRAARTVTLAELERAVAEAAQRDLGLARAEDVTIRFDRDVRSLQIEPAARGAARIVQFAYDSYTHRFEGIVEVPGSLSLRKQPLRLSGTATETAEVVVLARNVARGEMLRDTDILVDRLPRGEIALDALARPALVIGQAARRALRAGASLRPADLMKPDLVGRNDAVTIVFEVPGITLTARGKALTAGAEGDTVDVLNPHSKRVLQGTVRGPGTVVVGRGHTITADASGAGR